MTDQEHAARIRLMVEHLNQATTDALAQGLEVSFKTMESSGVGPHGENRIPARVMVDILRKL